MSHVAVVLIAGGVIVFRKDPIEIIEIKSLCSENFPELLIHPEHIVFAVYAPAVRIGQDDHRQLNLICLAKVTDSFQLPSILLGYRKILQGNRLLIPRFCLLPGNELLRGIKQLRGRLKAPFVSVPGRAEDFPAPFLPHILQHIRRPVVYPRRKVRQAGRLADERSRGHEPQIIPKPCSDGVLRHCLSPPEALRRPRILCPRSGQNLMVNSQNGRLNAVFPDGRRNGLPRIGKGLHVRRHIVGCPAADRIHRQRIDPLQTL